MRGGKKYVLDANVFIEAKNRYDGFRLCPGYWKALMVYHNSGDLVSIDKVRNELIATRNEGEQGEPGDSLSDWARNRVPETFFKKTQDRTVIAAFGDMMRWVGAQSQFTTPAREEFAKAADGWLIAFARVNGFVVVTHEEYAPSAQNRVPLPNVCRQFSIDYVNTFEMLEDLKVQFVLKTKRRNRPS